MTAFEILRCEVGATLPRAAKCSSPRWTKAGTTFCCHQADITPTLVASVSPGLAVSFGAKTAILGLVTRC
jgi:hypothetical protein